DVLYGAGHRGEGHEAAVVELAQLGDHELADPPRRQLALGGHAQLVHHRADRGLDLIFRHRPLVQRPVHAHAQLARIERLAPPVALDDHRQLEFDRLERAEPLPAGLALAPAPDRRPVFRRARVDDLGVLVLTEGAVHQAWGFGNRDWGFEKARAGDAFPDPEFPIANPGSSPIDGKLPALLRDAVADAAQDRLVFGRVEDVADPVGEPGAVVFGVAAGGHRRGADAQARGDEGLLRVVGHRVLVDRDVGLAEGFLGGLAGHALADHVDQHQVVLGAGGDDLVVALDDHLRHRPRVLHHLSLVGLELRLQRFLDGHRLGGDHVHQRAALDAGEDDALQLLADLGIGLARALLAGDDDAAARAAQGLVRGRGDHVGVRHRVGIHARGHEAGDVRHVHEQPGADLVGDRAVARPVDLLRVRAEAGNDHLRLVLQRESLDFVVIDQALLVHPVLHRVEQLARGVDLGAVGQVAAVRQRHAQDGVAGLQQGEVDGLVGLRAGVGLDIGVVGAEQLLEAVDGKLLGHVDVFAAAVVALARVAFGVLVGQLAALGLHHPWAGVVLAGDQLDVILLAARFVGNGLGQLGIVGFDAGVAREHLRSGGQGWPRDCTAPSRRSRWPLRGPETTEGAPAGAPSGTAAGNGPLPALSAGSGPRSGRW